MRRLAVMLSLLAAGAVLPAAARAQTVEFEVPERIEIVPGRLSVAFGETVAEAEARALLAELGYGVAAVSFQPVVVRAEADAALPDEALARLRAAPAVLTVEQVDRSGWIGQVQSAGAAGAFRPYEVVVTFTSDTSARQAARTVGRVKGLVLRETRKYPNEITIAVDEGDDERAVARLRRSRLVQDVYYLAQ